MKEIFCIVAAACSLMTAAAQERIEWRKDKVTQIIFPDNILKFRPGYTSDNALSQYDGRVMYIQPIMEIGETNLNVVTEDGNYYAFNLVYNSSALRVNYIIDPLMAIYRDEKVSSTIPSRTDTIPEANSESARSVPKEAEDTGLFAKAKKQGSYITANNVARLQKLTVILGGVYVDDKYLYLKFSIENSSNVPFDVDYIAFSITAKTTKKTSTQERMQIIPVGVDREIHRLDARTSCEVIYAFEKFTIGKDKILLAEVLEQGGDRNIRLSIQEGYLINARKL